MNEKMENLRMDADRKEKAAESVNEEVASLTQDKNGLEGDVSELVQKRNELEDELKEEDEKQMLLERDLNNGDRNLKIATSHNEELEGQMKAMIETDELIRLRLDRKQQAAEIFNKNS